MPTEMNITVTITFYLGSDRCKGEGPVPPPPPSLLDTFFYKSKVHEQKLVLGEYEVYSQNAGKGHFRDTNFQNISGGIPPDPPGKLAHWALVLPPPPPPPPHPRFKVLDLPLLDVSHLCNSRFKCLVQYWRKLFFNSTRTVSLCDIGQLERKKKCHHAAFYLWFLKLKA